MKIQVVSGVGHPEGLVVFKGSVTLDEGHIGHFISVPLP